MGGLRASRGGRDRPDVSTIPAFRRHVGSRCRCRRHQLTRPQVDELLELRVLENHPRDGRRSSPIRSSCGSSRRRPPRSGRTVEAPGGASTAVDPPGPPRVHSPSGGHGSLAQLAEQLTLNQRVVGSSPTRPTIRNSALENETPLPDLVRQGTRSIMSAAPQLPASAQVDSLPSRA